MESGGKRRRRGTSFWSNIDHPAVWLAYLPLFFIPWFFEFPSPAQIIGVIAGLIIFLGLYFAAIEAVGTRLVVLSVATLLLSFLLAFTASNWTVIAIYAAAMIANLRPARNAAVWVIAFAVATSALAVMLQQSAFYWVLGVFLMVMVGVGNISRAALEEKNSELSASRDEVRKLAAAAERERIGRDLHDLLGRTLTLIAIKADLAARIADRDVDRAKEEMRDIAAASREGLADVRAAVSGMTGASLSREIAASQTALASAGIASKVEGEAERIDPGSSAVLAMALREAVTNVIRHSGGSSCKIEFRQHADSLEMIVSDDGDGVAVRESGGIAGVRSRLAAVGGDFHIYGTDRGTRLTARLPVGAAT